MLRTVLRMSVLVLLLSPPPSWAARSLTLSPSQPIALRLELLQPTMLVLPEPVDTVVIALSPEAFMSEQKGAFLAVAILRADIAEGRFFVLGQSGTAYHFTYKLASPSDDLVHILAQAPPAAKAVPFSLSSWFRSLRQGILVPGSQPLDLPLAVSPDPRLQVMQTSALALGSQVGVTLAVRNTQATPLALDLQVGKPSSASAPQTLHLGQWPWPARYRLVALAAEPEVLAPEGEGRLYAILEARRP